MIVGPIEPGSAVPEPESVREQLAAEAEEAELGAEAEDGELAEAAEEASPKPPFLVRFWRSVRGWLFSFSLVFLAILLAEIFKGPIARFEAALAPHFQTVNWSLIGATTAGVLLFVAGAVYLGRHGVSMGPDEVEEMLERNREAMAGPAAWKRWNYRFRGTSVGRGFNVELGFRQVKEILRSPGWWRDPTRASLMAPIAGGLLVVFGGFSLVILHGPPWIKVLFGGWVLYALVRLTWALLAR